MKVSAKDLARAIGGRESVVAEYLPHILELAPQYGITTKIRLASFLAQIAHESANFTAVRENLNYSASALLAVFPRYFDASTAAQYARKPEAIANRVYANRMGNGSEASGDGWKYRGRGLIQLTGKNNYTAFANFCGVSVEKIIPFLERPRGAVLSALWFWKVNNLNAKADTPGIEDETRAINGGYNGLAHRKQLFDSILKIVQD